MNSLKDEVLKQLKEVNNDNLISDILNKSTADTEYLYICLEDQFNYCIRKSISL